MNNRRIKKLHFVEYGEDEGERTPFGYEFPSEIELKEFFNDAHEEFPEYDYFSFDYETTYGRCGTYTVQWYLIGNGTNNNRGAENGDKDD